MLKTKSFHQNCPVERIELALNMVNRTELGQFVGMFNNKSKFKIGKYVKAINNGTLKVN